MFSAVGWRRKQRAPSLLVMQWVLFLSVLISVCEYLLKATGLSFYWCVIDKDNHTIRNSKKSLPCEGCRSSAAERNFHRESRDVHSWAVSPCPSSLSGIAVTPASRKVQVWGRRLSSEEYDLRCIWYWKQRLTSEDIIPEKRSCWRPKAKEPWAAELVVLDSAPLRAQEAEW